ncbi:unnamed protein product, partial [Thelazia callipaeda]|uniref:GDP-Man:Man(3)GlcNAc(2)-PP-Dol alpha-1,2-mannosyltransferase n=1 Tax=Thelazia callipaeda TaxID=103827 RepID=A0A0N5CUZ5_THECL
FRIRKQQYTIAFFHPYCNAGGGGERVLWCAINAMQKRYGTKYRYIVYTGDVNVTHQEILQKAKECFKIDVIDTNLHFIYLRTRSLLESANYPHFTLLFQSLAGFIVGAEALLRYNPNIFIDTMGYPLTLPLFRYHALISYRWLAGCNVACYVHYPVISCDMINLVKCAEASYSNSRWIAQNRFLTYLKLMYYRVFAILYWLAGICSNLVLVNGTWTRDHIVSLWGIEDRTYLIYPPCNVDNLLRIHPNAEQLFQDERRVQLLSVGQIRPEKDHRLQIRFLSELKKRLLKENLNYKIRLVICGGCRDDKDVQRVKDLQLYAKNLELSSDDLEWELNAPANKLASLFEASLIGIHTMQNEHFGISVVEGIAAGQIMIAHNSGGPKLDILNANAVGSGIRLGLLASSVHVGYILSTNLQNVDSFLDFVDGILEILRMSPEERDAIRKAGRHSVYRFTEANFEKRWNHVIGKLIS